MGGKVMERVKNLLKAYKLLNAGTAWMGPAFMVLISVISAMMCIMMTFYTWALAKKGEGFSIPSLLIQLINLINLASILAINTVNANKKNNNLLLIQLPVEKRDIFNSKFFIMLKCAAPILLSVLYLLALNYFTGSIAYITASIGFFTVIFCLWFIVLSVGIGFSNLSSGKFKFAKLSIVGITALVLVFIIYSISVDFANLGKVSDIYNSLGRWFAPILKASGIFGSFGGLVLLVISLMIGYYLCVILPLKISKREG
jgi:hypothetical protein